MATASIPFPGSATWCPGNATSAGDRTATITFTATTADAYQYICPVPGHAQKGMAGTFVAASPGRITTHQPAQAPGTDSAASLCNTLEGHVDG